MRTPRWIVPLALIASGAAFAQDGAQLYQARGCTACHGPTGDKPIAPTYPKLAGQNAPYALQQMQDIKSGKRNNGLSQIMKPIVANVPDAELKAIAEWLAAQGGTP
jgi:cytochrome c